jgi:hypothetical protein
MTSVIDEEATVWAPGVDADIAAARRAGRKPTAGERWENWKLSVRRWDRRIWWFLGAWTALIGCMWVGAWLARGVVDANTRGQVAFAEALVGDQAAKATGSEAQAAQLLRALGDPWERWKGSCLPSSHAKTVVGVGVGRDGKPTDQMNLARSWEMVTAVQELGEIDLKTVYVGDVNGQIIAKPMMTDEAPGKMCFTATPAGAIGGN